MDSRKMIEFTFNLYVGDDAYDVVNTECRATSDKLTLIVISSHTRKFLKVRIHLRFKLTLGSFCKKNKVSSRYCRLTTPPEIKFGQSPLIKP
jgi:hypothetical protein